MGDLLRLIVSHALAVCLVSLCLLIIAGLLLSDWVENRRERRLLIMRARARHLHDGVPTEEILTTDDKLRQELRQHRPVFRLFRWEFLVVSLALLATLAPLGRPKVGEVAASSDATRTPKPTPLRSGSNFTPGFNAPTLSLTLPIPASKPSPGSLRYRINSQTKAELLATDTALPLVSFGSMDIERGYLDALPVRSLQPASRARTSAWHPE